jgi:hypothetical protein
VFCKTNHFAKLFMVYTSVLPKHLSVYNLSGLFIRIGEKLSQGYNRVHKSYLVIGNYKKKHMESRHHLFFWCALSIAPPFFPYCTLHISYSLYFTQSTVVERRRAQSSWYQTSFGFYSNDFCFDSDIGRRRGRGRRQRRRQKRQRWRRRK